MNSFKTFILIALMTGLLVVLGDLFYGRDGAVMALVIGLALNGFSYFFSDRIVLMSYRAKVVTQQDAPQLYAAVENLSMRSGLPMPKVAIVPDQTPNAFATGRNPNHAVVAVTEGIMQSLSQNELEGVLAHELGHIKHRDILIGSFSAVLSQAIMFLSRMAYWVTPHDRDRSSNQIAAMAVMILAPLAALILQMAISRSREYMADDFSAKITGRPDQLASALEKISGYNKRTPMQHAEPTSAHMMIVNPLSGSSLASLFSTHPPIKKRIERLNAIKI
ncbi:MAG: zinc metalloprotease HtpX [Holophagales bacterium]|nr:zinc metalloprotease HtpX [Holophagales bacterium]